MNGVETTTNETPVLELLVNARNLLSSEVELEKLVQRITDLGIGLTNATFGTFIFDRTFQGGHVVRHDDVTSQPPGRGRLLHRSPKGDLPVRSYLAAPVVSATTGEVYGGLFFGHPEAGVFTEDSERMIEAIAALAAISITNAQLLEEKKNAEEKLREQNALINTITNITRQALFMFNERQECTYMNPAAAEMTGYCFEEVKGRHVNIFHYPVEESAIDRALLTGVTVQGEDHFIHKDGRFINITFTASPIIDGGVPKGTVIEARDTTIEQRRAAEIKFREWSTKELLEQKVKERTAELEKINYELMQFTSVASHDLKEPLRKISVFGKLLRERASDRLDPLMIKYTDNIVQSSERMTRLIDDLLVFSRLSQTDITWEKVDLNALLEQIVSDLEVTMADKNAMICFDGLPVVRGVPLQLGQVFQNLISNSMKFSVPGKTPRIMISSSVVEKDGSKFNCVRFADNGIGFDNTYAEKIFEIFQRLHTRDRFEGTGVGLAIVKKIIAMHEGEVRAYSNESGATFEILLPIT